MQFSIIILGCLFLFVHGMDIDMTVPTPVDQKLDYLGNLIDNVLECPLNHRKLRVNLSKSFVALITIAVILPRSHHTPEGL